LNESRGDDGRKVGGCEAQKLWRLNGVGVASRIVWSKRDAGAHAEATEIVVRTADVP